MNNQQHRYVVAGLLGLSALLLASLIPGGPIENRDFSHIHPLVLGTFNVFLTCLYLGSAVLAYYTFRGHRWAFRWALFAAIAFFSVYAIDLAQIFPQSPSPMSRALAFVEVLGMTIAVPLIVYSRNSKSMDESLLIVQQSIQKPPNILRLSSLRFLVWRLSYSRQTQQWTAESTQCGLVAYPGSSLRNHRRYGLRVQLIYATHVENLLPTQTVSFEFIMTGILNFHVLQSSAFSISSVMK